MAVYKSMSSLEAALQKKVKAAMQDINKKVVGKAQDNVAQFYTGEPHFYKRTGKLGKTPDTNGVTGQGNHYSTDVFLNDDYVYNTGTWTATQVINAAETGKGNLIGSSGFWERTLDSIPDIIEASMNGAGFR